MEIHRKPREDRTHESMITMLDPLLIFLRYDIFKATKSASTFFGFLTRLLTVLGKSSKLKQKGKNFEIHFTDYFLKAIAYFFFHILSIYTKICMGEGKNRSIGC